MKVSCANTICQTDTAQGGNRYWDSQSKHLNWCYKGLCSVSKEDTCTQVIPPVRTCSTVRQYITSKQKQYRHLRQTNLTYRVSFIGTNVTQRLTKRPRHIHWTCYPTAEAIGGTPICTWSTKCTDGTICLQPRYLFNPTSSMQGKRNFT